MKKLEKTSIVVNTIENGQIVHSEPKKRTVFSNKDKFYMFYKGQYRELVKTEQDNNWMLDYTIPVVAAQANVEGNA